ncbi:MAG TPA: DUF1579 domain-containing protein [Candidatus Polarisedimenticolaceae bacterium]|nr:DUF1579 domain-containing protein [Candidatus Polarisedimenticolaceae bacterium]
MAKKKHAKKAIKKSLKAAKKSAPRRPAAKKRAAKKPMSEAEMMAQWQAASTPAEGHQRLAPMVGKWSAVTEFVMAPGAPAQKHGGTSENELVLGGRYLRQVYRGLAMGMPFEGIGYTGYDNPSKRYVGTWMDTFGTGLMNSVGTGKPSDQKLTFAAEAIEPSGKTVLFDCIITIQDRDHHAYEMWTKAPNGKRYRTMRVDYVRA